MKLDIFAAILATYIFQDGAAAGPILSALNTPLTILKEVDFWVQYSTRTSSAILVESQNPFSIAEAACGSLNENLWSPEVQDFMAGVNSTLAYQVYLNKFPQNQRFWVAPLTNSSCRTIGVNGNLRVANCENNFPTLCSHSGVLSNVTYKDTSSEYQVRVSVRTQTLTGWRDAYGWRFDGVRYAEQPARFEHTTVYDHSGPASALEFGSACLQPGYGSEDCFFLNIATPYLPDSARQNLKPILFFIHGGSFKVNNGNLGNYDGVPLAMRGDVVVVKINYRLGNFGFLALDDTAITGNYGIGDMITALKWVHANIDAFGGDKSRITISGDSAGAAGVRALLASEAAAGLFSAGVMQSEPIGWDIDSTDRFATYMTLAEATTFTGSSIVQQAGCDTAADPVACMKTVSASTLLNTQIQAFLPVVDNQILEVKRLPVNGGGYAANVPMMMGHVRDEQAIFLSLNGYTGDTSSFVDYLNFVDGLFDPHANDEDFNGASIDMSSFATNPAFPVPPGPKGAFNATQRLLTDAQGKCGTWATAYSSTKHSVFPNVWAYEFNRTYQTMYFTVPECDAPVTSGHPLGDPDQEYFKCHSGELDTSLGFLLYGGEEPRDENDIPFQQLLVDYWTSFTWNHNPNPKKAYLKVRNYWNTLNQVEASGRWNQVHHKNPKMRKIQWNGSMVPFSEAEQCAALGLPLNYLE